MIDLINSWIHLTPKTSWLLCSKHQVEKEYVIDIFPNFHYTWSVDDLVRQWLGHELEDKRKTRREEMKWNKSPLFVPIIWLFDTFLSCLIYVLLISKCNRLYDFWMFYHLTRGRTGGKDNARTINEQNADVSRRKSSWDFCYSLFLSSSLPPSISVLMTWTNGLESVQNSCIPDDSRLSSPHFTDPKISSDENDRKWEIRNVNTYHDR